MYPKKSALLPLTPRRWRVVDWRGYHKVSPIDILPWRCSWRHSTSQPFPAKLTRRLRHINHTSHGAWKTVRPRQLSKDHLPYRWSGGFQLSTVVTFQCSWSRLARTVVRLSLLESRGSSPVNPQSCDVTGPWAHEHRALLPPHCLINHDRYFIVIHLHSYFHYTQSRRNIQTFCKPCTVKHWFDTGSYLPSSGPLWNSSFNIEICKPYSVAV